MAEMIERVARAIYHRIDAHFERYGSGQIEAVADLVDVTIEGRVDLLEVARAAIEEMREPTEAQIDAGVAARMRMYEKMEADGVDTRTVLVSKHPAGTIYAAMIEAALKGEKE